MMRYHDPPIRMAKIKNSKINKYSDNTKCWQRHGETGLLIYF